MEFEGHDLGRDGRRPRPWLVASEVVGAWVATADGDVLGHAALSRASFDVATGKRWQELTGHDPTGLGCVSRLFVRPRSRRLGIGTALLDRVREEIHAEGLLPVVETPDPYPGTEAFLSSRGWRLMAADAASGRRGRVKRFAFPTAVGADLVVGRRAVARPPVLEEDPL